MKYFFISSLIIAASTGFAQDTLYTVSGQKIAAKVIEINQTEIKYKKSNNIDGPTYVVDKTDVALIEYKNGTKELYGNGTDISSDDQSVASNDPQPKQRINVIIGGGWGWSAWPLFNSWSWWGGYRSYPRWHYHRHHYFKPHRHHHKRVYHGRRGR